MSESTTEADEVVEAYVDIWNDWEYARIPDVVSDSFVIHDPAIGEDVGGGPAGEAHGRDGLESLMNRVEDGFPDFHISINDLLAGETVVMSSLSSRRWHTESSGINQRGTETRRSVGLR